MNSLIDKYRGLIADKEATLMQYRKRRNLLFVAKIVTFVAILISGYMAVDGAPLYRVLVAVASYLVALFVDFKVQSREREAKAYVQSYSREVSYLEGEFSPEDDGREYISTQHEYSFDLDIFGPNSLFSEMNRTVSPAGRAKLVESLSGGDLSELTISERSEAIEELSEKLDWMHSFLVAGALNPLKEGYDPQGVEQWQQSRVRGVGALKWLCYVLNALCGVSLLGLILGVIPYPAFVGIATLQLAISVCYMVVVMRAHVRLDRLIGQVSNYFYLIDIIQSESYSGRLMREYQANLSGERDALRAFKELKRIQKGLDQRGSVISVVGMNALYMKDIHLYVSLCQWRERYASLLDGWVQTVGRIDELVSQANYRCNHPEFIVPQMSHDVIIDARDMAHPMMRSTKVVANDFRVGSMHEIFIITGANMAGKSTFLRSVGVNLVLAKMGNVVRAGSFNFCPIPLFTSMRTTDNLSSGTSYFHAELLRLKRLHELAEDGRPVFIILDEMLKGTNSTDKLNGSRRFLERLLGMNIAGITATHDLALGELASAYPQNFKNACFEIEHHADEVVYTYKLQEGVSRNMNASFLLEKMNLI